MMEHEELKTWAALIPAFKDIHIGRRAPAGNPQLFFTRSSDDTEIFCRISVSDSRRVVIVAHPAVVGSRYRHVTRLFEALRGRFSTVTFDFRGHGRSGGRCPLGFDSVSRDLESVVDRIRRMGYESVGVAGFSLGAAAAFLLASRRHCIDSMVSIGCPPYLPDLPAFENHPLGAAVALRLLGMRSSPEREPSTTPLGVAPQLPHIPKLLIFGEWEVVGEADIESFIDSVSLPREVFRVPGAWHADLLGRETLVREWFEKTLG